MKKVTSPYISGDITLRMLEERDLPLTLSWRNNPETRIWFKNSDEIKLESHKIWFKSYRKKQDDYVFIAECNNELIGQLALYKISNGTAEIGRFIASPESKGKGLMRKSILALIEMARKQFFIQHIILEVYKDNTRAIDLYSSIGFFTLESNEYASELITMEMKIEH